MSRFALFLLCAVVASAALKITKPIPELSLTDGRTLKNVQVVSFGTSTAMAKWDGGRGTISYDLFPAAYHEEIALMRPERGPTRASPPQPVLRETPATPPPAATPVEPVPVVVVKRPAVRGEVFSKGFDEVYKFSGAVIHFHDLQLAETAIKYAVSDKPDMPPILGTAKTDSEGRFELDLPPGSYLAVASERRRYRGGNSVLFHWRVPVEVTEDGATVSLDDSNKTIEQELIYESDWAGNPRIRRR